MRECLLVGESVLESMNLTTVEALMKNLYLKKLLDIIAHSFRLDLMEFENFCDGEE